MNTENMTTLQRVAAYRFNRDILSDWFYGTVTKVTGTGQVTVLPDKTENGYQREAVRFNNRGEELGGRSWGLTLTTPEQLKEWQDAIAARRALRSAHHELAEAVNAVGKNGYGDIFPDAEWMTKVEAAVATMKALVK